MCGIVLQPRGASGAQVPADDIEQALQRFLVSFSNRDVPAFSPFFAEDATVFFPGRLLGRVQGRAGIARAFTDLFGPPVSPPGSAALIQPQDLLIQWFDGFAVATFIWGPRPRADDGHSCFDESGPTGRSRTCTRRR